MRQMTEVPGVKDDLPNPRQQLVLAGVFLVMMAGAAVDLAFDRPRSWWSAHVVFELCLIAVSLGLAAYLWWSWYRTTRSLAETRLALDKHEAERDAWQASARGVLDGLAAAIERQLAAWDLTAAERDVALYLLRGMSHKQIAAATDRSERTVRQHAIAVYRKSRLDGRAELAAYFLSGLPSPGPSSPDDSSR
jgi:DNA-binding CsgD family transcriptional regulator